MRGISNVSERYYVPIYVKQTKAGRFKARNPSIHPLDQLYNTSLLLRPRLLSPLRSTQRIPNSAQHNQRSASPQHGPIHILILPSTPNSLQIHKQMTPKNAPFNAHHQTRCFPDDEDERDGEGADARCEPVYACDAEELGERVEEEGEVWGWYGEVDCGSGR